MRKASLLGYSMILLALAIVAGAAVIEIVPSLTGLSVYENKTNETMPPVIGIDEASVTSIILNSTYGTNRTVENLTVNYTLDGANAKAIINWYKDNSSIIILNMPFENRTANNPNSTRDYSPGGVNASVFNATFNATGGYDGKGAYQFNGTPAVIEYVNEKLLTIKNGVTMTAWVKSYQEGFIAAKSDFQGQLFFIDTFGGADGTSLIEHDPNFGESWETGYAKNSTATIYNNTLTHESYPEENGNAGFIAVTGNDVGSKDYNVSITVGNVDTFDDTISLYARWLDSDNYYQIRFSSTASDLYGKLYKRVGGVCTQLDAQEDLHAKAGDNITLRVNDDTISGYINGVRKTFAVDLSLAAPGKAGVGIGASPCEPGDDANNQTVDNFRVNVLVNNNIPFMMSTVNGGEFSIMRNNIIYNATSSTDINDGEWHHIAGTYNKSETRLYIDGNLEATNTEFTENLPTVIPTIIIGRNYSNSTTGFFNGTIDELAVYNRSLSAEQVKALYENRTDMILSQETRYRDVWQACIIPNDDEGDGSETCSNNLTIRDPFYIEEIYAPSPQGYGNVSMYANITDLSNQSDIDTVIAEVTRPSGAKTNCTMQNTSLYIWKTLTCQFFVNGTYSFKVYVNESDTGIAKVSEEESFMVIEDDEFNLTTSVEMNIRTDKDTYYNTIDLNTGEYTNSDYVVLNNKSELENLSFKISIKVKSVGGEVFNFTQADIVWVLDASGSMGDEQESIAENAQLFAQSLNQSGVDYQMGVVGYLGIGDYWGGHPYTTTSHSWPVGTNTIPTTPLAGTGRWTTDAPTFGNMVVSVPENGWIENGLAALNETLNHYTFRENSTKFFILITDEDDDLYEGAKGNLGDPYLEDIIETLNQNGTTVFVVTYPSEFWFPEYVGAKGVAEKTGGKVYNIYEDFSTIIADLAEAIASEAVLNTIPIDSAYAFGEWQSQGGKTVRELVEESIAEPDSGIPEDLYNSSLYEILEYGLIVSEAVDSAGTSYKDLVQIKLAYSAEGDPVDSSNLTEAENASVFLLYPDLDDLSYAKNNLDANTSGYLLMKVQRWNGTVFEDNETLISDYFVTVEANNYLWLQDLWNANLYSTENKTEGTYRAYAALTDNLGNVLINSNGEPMETYYNFEIDSVKVTPEFCDFTIYNSTNLTSSVGFLNGTGSNSGAACITIGADNVVLDCQGLYLVGAGNGTQDGIRAENKTNITIKNCMLDNFDGYNTMYMKDITNLELTNNKVTDSGTYGTYIRSASGANLTGNEVSDSFRGIYIYNSTDVTMRNNIFHENEQNFGLSGPSSLPEYRLFYHDIDTSNSVNYKTLYYEIGEENRIFDSDDDVGALYCVNCSNITLKDLNLSNNMWGAYFINSSSVMITNVTAAENRLGIFLYNDEGVINDVHVYNSTFEGNDGYAGFSMEGTNARISNVEISGNRMTDNNGGIWIYGNVSNMVIDSNNITETDYEAIYFDDAVMNASIINNNLSDNYYVAVWFDGSVENSSIIGNQINENLDWGFNVGYYQDSFSNNRIENNIISENSGGAFYVGAFTMQNNQIINNSFNDNDEWGIYLDAYATNDELVHFDNNNISYNTATGNLETGIYIEIDGDEDYMYQNSFSGNTINSNNLSENWDSGMYWLPYGMNVIDNEFSHNTMNWNAWAGLWVGVYDSNIHNTTFNNNTALFNDASGDDGVGIWMETDYNTTGNVFSNNNLSHNTLTGLWTDMWGDYVTNNVYINNTLNNNSIYALWIETDYFYGNTVVNNVANDNGEYAGISIGYDYVKDNIIENNTANNNIVGLEIMADSYSNNSIKYNDFSYNDYGISTWNRNDLSSKGDIIHANRITHNWYGIYLDDYYNSTISSNNISNNALVGIYLKSNKTAIFNNTITGSDIGIYAENKLYEESIIYNNYFENTINANLYSNASLNSSRNCSARNIVGGNCTGGNFWSDYTGLDDGSGGRTEGDGIGDTNIPHPVSGNVTSADYLPLVFENLKLWDETDAEGGGLTRYPGENISFWSTYEYNLQEAKNATCVIEFEDGFYANMTRNISTYQVPVWGVEYVAANATFAQIAVNSSGEPRVVFDIPGRVIYAWRNSSGEWTNSTVESFNPSQKRVFSSISMKLNSSGAPNIAYVIYNSSDSRHYLQHAVYNGTEWNITTVRNTTSQLYSPSIALWEDNPSIAVCEQKDLTFYNFSGGWTGKNLSSLFLTSYERPCIMRNSTIDMEYRSTGLPVIVFVYYAGSNHAVYYTSPSGTGWEIQQVSGATSSENHTLDMEIDSKDGFHVTFARVRSSWLYHYWTYLAITYRNRDTFAVFDQGDQTAIGLSSSDELHIIHDTKAHTSTLKYIYEENGTYNYETITDMGNATKTSLAIDLDSSDTVHVAFVNNTGIYYVTETTENRTRTYYTYSRNFSSAGTHPWNVTCNQTGFPNATKETTVSISPPYEFADASIISPDENISVLQNSLLEVTSRTGCAGPSNCTDFNVTLYYGSSQVSMNSSNVSCLANIMPGEYCAQTWNLNASGAPGEEWEIYAEYAGQSSTQTNSTWITITGVANISIWDETDAKGGGLVKYIGDDVRLWANYTNLSGEGIEGATCTIDLYDGEAEMDYNSTTELYQYNKTFDTPGLSEWQVTCNKTDYEDESVMDEANISFMHSNLTAWDDTGAMGGGLTRYPEDRVMFWANYTNETEGAIEGAECAIEFEDVSAVMEYNATIGLYQHNRTFNSTAPTEWNVSCNKTGYYNRTAQGSVNITIISSSLEIWEETDAKGGNLTKYPSDSVMFWANYTNSSDGAIESATCTIKFTDSSSSMTQNSTTGIYYYSRSFSAAGTYEWNVTCSQTRHEEKNVTSAVTINQTPEAPPTPPTGGGGGGGGGAPTPPETPTAPEVPFVPPSIPEIPATPSPEPTPEAPAVIAAPPAGGGCTEVLQRTSATSLTTREVPIGQIEIPAGYSVVKEPFRIDCRGDSFFMTLNIPSNYRDIKALRCRGGTCLTEVETTTTTTFECGVAIEEEVVEEARFMPVEQMETIISEEKSITEIDRTVETGKNRIEFTTPIPIDLLASIQSPTRQVREPDNPDLNIIGTPIVAKIKSESRNFGATITLPYAKEGIEEGSAQIFVAQEQGWVVLEGTINREEQTIGAKIDNIAQYLNENGEAVFAVMAVKCQFCETSEFEKVYQYPGSRDAILLIHGLGSSPETFQNMIDEFEYNQQPWQIWTYGYSSSRDIDVVAEELRNFIEAHSLEFDNIYIVAHSLGGLITQTALHEADLNRARYTFVSKVRKAILLGVPNEGSPGAEVLKNLHKYLVNFKDRGGLFNVNSETIDDLVKGRIVPRVPGVDYYVLAGTQPYEFNLGLFKVSSGTLDITEPNDGIVTVTSAQHIGEDYINNMCEDYWEIKVTHTEMLDVTPSVRVIQKILSDSIAEQYAGRNLVGQNQYFKLRIDECTGQDTYLLIGQEIREEEVADELCGCGNGFCGEGEDALSCPSDCARIITAENVFVSGPVIIYALTVLTYLTTLLYAFKRHIFKKAVGRKLPFAFFILAAGATALYRANFGVDLVLVYVTLPLAIVYMAAMDRIMPRIISVTAPRPAPKPAPAPAPVPKAVPRHAMPPKPAVRLRMELPPGPEVKKPRVSFMRRLARKPAKPKAEELWSEEKSQAEVNMLRRRVSELRKRLKKDIEDMKGERKQ